MMKKNRSLVKIAHTKHTSSSSGLFQSPLRRQTLLDDLRKGTLFRLTTSIPPPPPIITKKQLDFRPPTPELWLDKIQVTEKEIPSWKREKTEESIKKNKLPGLRQPRVSGNNKQFKAEKLKKKHKVECFEVRLSKYGAWNKQNPRNVDNNVSRLEESLQLDEGDLRSNDLSRAGLNMRDSSFDESVHRLDQTSLLRNSAFPCPKLSDVSPPKRQWQQRTTHRALQQTRGHFIPKFLLQTISSFHTKASPVPA